MWVKMIEALPLYGRVRKAGEVVNLNEKLAMNVIKAGGAQKAPRPQLETLEPGNAEDMFGAPKGESEAERIPRDTDELQFQRQGPGHTLDTPPGFSMLCSVADWAVFIKDSESLDKLKAASLKELAVALDIEDLSGTKAKLMERIKAHPVFVYIAGAEQS